MDLKTFSELTNEELLEKKKELRKRKIINASIIGFLIGVMGFGFTAWILGDKKNFIGFMLPMLFPIYFIYKLVKNSKNDKALEKVLKERNLYKQPNDMT